jgi:N-acetyl-1-D-myo-inositol-2-amino-2-deoxy-alpha-D-glucopyranoside deacetylase
MAQRRIMAVYGHPDDEGQVTGTLAKLIAGGDQVTLVCLTRGEVGEISDPALSSQETLGYVRELELRAAMAQIGLRDVRFGGFRDSGMAGTPENDDPRCLHQQPADAVILELVRIMREVRPHLVFTWDPEGGYGHPDHLASHSHTLAAFDACGDATAFPEAGPAWTPSRLYWGARGMKNRARVTLEMERRGLLAEPIPPERRERFENALAEPDPAVSVVSDVREFIAVRRAANRMHRTQFGVDGFAARVPEDLQDQLYGEERFYQARPPWPEGAPPVADFPGAAELESVPG